MSSAKKITGMFNNRTPKDLLQLFSSLIFLGLACYIAFFLELPHGGSRQDLYMIAALTGSYGLWKLWKSISG